MTIPVPELQPSAEDGSIPAIATIRPETQESPEALPVLISFSKYKIKECQLSSSVNPKQAHRALCMIRDIGMHVRSGSDFVSKYFPAGIKPIISDGDYSSLYNKDIPEDVEILETRVAETGDETRLFFYIAQDTLYMIAIKGTHIDTTKGTYHEKKRRQKFHERRFPRGGR